MTLVIPAGYANAIYRFALTGDPEEMISTIGITNVGPAEGQAVANDLAADFRAAFPVGLIVTGYSFLGVRLYVGPGPNHAVFESALVNHVGTNPGPALPQNVAFLVSKKTANAGRRFRGRMFLPPFVIGEDSVSIIGKLGPAQVADIQTKVNNWLMVPPAYPKVLLHDDASLSPLPPPTDIVNLVVSDTVATTRRRLRR